MKPLAGLRVADFTVHAAGPFCTHMLSQLGAEVIKIETALRPDIFRKPHAVYGRQGPATFDQVSSNKLSIRLNLKHRNGFDLAKRLVAVSDVAVESFRAGVMDRLGLGYEALRKVRSDIVLVSVSSSGQSGPDSHFAGYAPLFGAWGGIGHLSGHADGPPAEMRHVMDHSVGMNAAMSTVAALHHRRRTGEGCHVDVAAREVASSLVGESLTAASAGIATERMGNDDLRRAPHGLYPTCDKDKWLSIAVASDVEWKRLAKVLGDPDLEMDGRYATERRRYENRSSLDPKIASWTETQDGETASQLLQQNGVSSHVSWAASDIVEDPHMRARGSIIDVAETDGSIRAAVGRPARFSTDDTPGITRGTPQLGEDENYVFEELLGLDRKTVEALVADKAIY